MKKLFCCPALELFCCLPPLFRCLPLWTTVRLHGKKLQNATNISLLRGIWVSSYRLQTTTAQSRQHWHMSSIQQNCHPKGCSKPIFAEQSFSNDDQFLAPVSDRHAQYIIMDYCMLARVQSTVVCCWLWSFQLKH